MTSAEARKAGPRMNEIQETTRFLVGFGEIDEEIFSKRVRREPRKICAIRRFQLLWSNHKNFVMGPREQEEAVGPPQDGAELQYRASMDMFRRIQDDDADNPSIALLMATTGEDIAEERGL